MLVAVSLSSNRSTAHKTLPFSKYMYWCMFFMLEWKVNSNNCRRIHVVCININNSEFERASRKWEMGLCSK